MARSVHRTPSQHECVGLPSEQEGLEWWKAYELEKNYELLAGGLAGDSLGCFG